MIGESVPIFRVITLMEMPLLRMSVDYAIPYMACYWLHMCSLSVLFS